MNALVMYLSPGGNTKKVAETIHNTLTSGGIDSVLKTVEEAKADDIFDYDIVCLGAPSYMWQPPAPVQDYIKGKMGEYNKKGVIKPCCPRVPGKRAAVFVTYAGPHTGIDEAIPVGKYMAQFFAHLGYEVVGEWYTVGEFHGSEENSTKGKLGDIRGRPSQQDLDDIAGNVKDLLKTING